MRNLNCCKCGMNLTDHVKLGVRSHHYFLIDNKLYCYECGKSARKIDIDKTIGDVDG